MRGAHSQAQQTTSSGVAIDFGAATGSSDRLRAGMRAWLNEKTTTPEPLLSVVAAPSFLFNQHVLSSSQFNKAQVEQVIATAAYVQQLQEQRGPLDILSDKKLGVMFFEGSARTSSSLQAAMHQMGGKVVRFESEVSESVSIETLAEAMQAFGSHCDALAVRHGEAGGIQVAAQGCTVPILNMGDGNAEHPTQALLDAAVISGEFGAIDGLTVTMVGDLASSRTAHSMLQLLSNFDVNINLVADRNSAMPDAYKNSALAIAAQHDAQAEIQAVEDLREVLGETDVLFYAGRDLHDSKMQLQRAMKRSAILMHTEPRTLFKEACSRPAYYKQLAYSQSVRAALLCMLYGKL
jgi:aspartate carbamoyltransferase catalytic subunit